MKPLNEATVCTYVCMYVANSYRMGSIYVRNYSLHRQLQSDESMLYFTYVRSYMHMYMYMYIGYKYMHYYINNTYLN